MTCTGVVHAPGYRAAGSHVGCTFRGVHADGGSTFHGCMFLAPAIPATRPLTDIGRLVPVCTRHDQGGGDDMADSKPTTKRENDAIKAEGDRRGSRNADPRQAK